MIKAIFKYVMNKAINNKTEIKLENKDGDGISWFSPDLTSAWVAKP